MHNCRLKYGAGLLGSAILIVILAATSPLFSQDDTSGEGWNAKLSGYYKNLFMYQEKGTWYDAGYLPDERRMLSDLNRLKLSPEITWSDSFIFHTDADIEGIFSNYGDTSVFDSYWLDQDYNRLTKPHREFVNNENTCIRAEIRNMYAKMVMGSFTGTLGRQQVRFGSSRLWNPLDLLNPFSPLLVEGADEQTGIDALRVDWYPSDYTELALAANPARKNDSLDETNAGSGNYIARFKAGLDRVDVAVLAGYTAKRRNYGFDFQQVLLDGMLTGVVLCSDPQEGASFWQCGAGYEYTFASGLYLLTEYFYNSLPVNEDDELADALSSAALSGINSSSYYILSNRMITYNSHYLSAAAGYDFHPLVRGELFSIYDFQGRGIFINTSVTWNAAENLDITAGTICSRVHPGGKTSDFDTYDNKPAFYFSAIFYF